ncbi:uncharacterized protein LOC135379071 [Ornithodoros turicata]|uniref:uncharacterized protein LOC135379071 n=1 Tax=Ornithodoros turicata TaxID=34597 RepID=UPI003139625F
MYAAAFFNAINIIFAPMTNPRIKFEVARLYAQEAGFTHALTLVDDEVDFNASLSSVSKFISTRPQMNSSDIVFVFCGRKVFTRGSYGKKLYSPQGLTWEGGICNDEKKVVLVNDIANIFYALPNAGFQLARLLGAPASCTPNFSRLGGRSHPFFPTNCTMNSIRTFLRQLKRKNSSQARECFRKKYNSSVSSNFYNVLPGKIANEDEYCKKVGDLLKEPRDRGLCSREATRRVYESPELKNVTHSRKKPCIFDCCSISDNQKQVTFHTNLAFDGKPCGEKGDGKICFYGVCL